jgi:branched-chain amino acid transport system substrate-binding protein
MRAGISRAALVAATLAAGWVGAAAQAPGISDGVVRIGVLTDMNGVFSDLAGAGAVTAA